MLLQKCFLLRVYIYYLPIYIIYTLNLETCLHIGKIINYYTETKRVDKILYSQKIYPCVILFIQE